MSNLIVACRQATQGHGNAAMLLMRVLHWWPKARIGHGGKAWIVKAAADWCDDTGLSARQYERAVARLRQLGLVVTEQHLVQNRTITHLRLTEHGLALVRESAHD